MENIKKPQTGIDILADITKRDLERHLQTRYRNQIRIKDYTEHMRHHINAFMRYGVVRFWNKVC